jgi:hypothetical protein
MNLTKGLRNSVTELIAMCDQEIERWSTTRDQLKTMTLLNRNGHAQNNAVEAMTEAALQVHQTRKAKRPYVKKTHRLSVGKPLPEMAVPADMPDITGMNLRDAAKATVVAAKQSLSVKEATSIMVGAGFKFHEGAPPARVVGVQLSFLAKSKDLKKSATGLYRAR